jgi:mannosyltransferase OCH1-like enzyme
MKLHDVISEYLAYQGSIGRIFTSRRFLLRACGGVKQAIDRGDDRRQTSMLINLLMQGIKVSW